MKKLLSLVLSILLICIHSFSQTGSKLQFIENKGQWDNKVKFKGEMTTGAFFLTSTGFTVVQHNSHDVQLLAQFVHGELQKPPVHLKLRSHAYSMDFLNASMTDVVAEKPGSSYNNYFIGNDPTKWVSGCKMSEGVTYKNIYPNIDVRYYSSNGRIKYDLIVKPGANVGDITLQYKGVDGLAIINEELVLKTSVGDIKELVPYSYQLENGKQSEVQCKFKVSGNTVKFEVGDYSKDKTLTIDPTLFFSTFTGSTADNWGHTATYGSDGSFFAGGIVFGTGFPTNIGAFDSTYNGGTMDEENIPGFDMGIIKFSADGKNRIYATYIGGAGNEAPFSLIADPQGNLVIAGRTSSINYPTTVANFGICGGYDIFLTKLNAAGTALIGSRKIGGSGKDGVNIRLKYATPFGTETIRRNYGDDARSEVILENNGNIILASCTQSQDFPVTASAFQKTFAGKQDAVVIKASPDINNIIFSSFLGGAEADAGFVLAINPLNNNIYVGGNTANSILPGDKTSVLYPTFQGGETDGFVSIISSEGSSLLKTSYIGTAGNDMLYGIDFDVSGFPYITGTTTGTWPLINAAFSQTGGKQFISKLKQDLSGYQYSTVFGTNSIAPNISPAAFLVDKCENVYVSGWGGDVDTKSGFRDNAGTNGLAVTPDAIKKVTDNKDFYFFVLQKDAASQLYGSFFGQDGGFGEHIDGGTSRFTKEGVLYQAICANCGRDVVFPTTPDAWSTTNGSKECNLAAIKIDFGICTSSLPVHLAVFNGTIQNNFHLLNWQVNNEQKGDTYIIEQRATPGEAFTTTYTTLAIADKAANTYSAKLRAPARSTTFYRLKVISINGNITYSPLVLLENTIKNVFKAFVSQNTLYLHYPSNSKTISLFTANGKLLQQQGVIAGSNIQTISLNKIPRGTIIIKVQAEKSVLATKVIY